MHREVVERRGWLDERRFTDALNFCMLLPGPEALQLAIYLGWKLHGMRGGLVAGLGFIVPSILLLLALSYAYARFGGLPAVEGVLLGLKAAVVVLVAQALVKIGRRALRSPLHVLLAVFAFVALEFLGIPFPLLVAAAGLLGAAVAWRFPRPAIADRPLQPGTASSTRVVTVGLALWLAPLALGAALSGTDSLWTRIYLFFTQTALVTFGGAYAVLGYVTQHLVQDLGWLTADQAVAGLALAETTPGPLVIVLQFMGFMAGWNEPGSLAPAAAAVVAALLASWATFLPSFVFIFLGAPHVERISHEPRIAAALAAITAAVVGVIASLTLLLAKVVLLPGGLAAGPSWPAIAIGVGAWLLLQRTRLALPWVLVAAALAGLGAEFAGWA